MNVHEEENNPGLKKKKKKEKKKRSVNNFFVRLFLKKNCLLEGSLGYSKTKTLKDMMSK